MYEIFVRFKALVENQFNYRIVTLYSDNGGKYQALNGFLSTNGISHFTTLPYKPEHNGISERCHCHIVEIGLTLLTHASMAITYWNYAFAIAGDLIIRLPKSTLHLSYPFEKLFASQPNCTKLQVSSCLCYPWLCPYSQDKLDYRSTPFVFLGHYLNIECLYLS